MAWTVPPASSSGGAAEVVGKRLGGSLLGVPPTGEIELLSTQQSQKIGTQSPIKQWMEDEVGEVADAVWTRAVAVMVRIVR